MIMKLTLVTFNVFLVIAFTQNAHAVKKCDDALAERERLVTGQKDEYNFKMNAEVLGKKMTFKGVIGDEVETRLILDKAFKDPHPPSYNPFQHSTAPKAKLAKGSLEILRMLGRYKSLPLGMVTTKERIKTTEYTGYKEKEYSLALKPLKTINESWHGNATGFLDDNSAFTHSLNVRTNIAVHAGDILRENIIVGAQFEVSRYFDTRGDKLAEQEIAVRIKTWYPYNGGEKSTRAHSGRALFIKINAPSRNDPFHRRRELRIPLPDNVQDKDITPIVQAAIAKMGGRSFTGVLEAKKQIVNRRLSVHLDLHTVSSTLVSDREYDETRIGFACFDSFSFIEPNAVVNPSSFAENQFNSRTTHHQVEFEIFDNSQGLFKPGSKLTDLFLQLENSIGGTLTKVPKYLTGP